MVLQCGTVTYASTHTSTNAENVKIASDVQISPYAEQTAWKYRIQDGQLQKRLWSLTYGHWIGEWIDIN